MEKTLVNSSGIFYLKSKFFLIRVLSYFSFLLLPVLTQKSVQLPFIFSSFAAIFYILFIMSQWFFLGKEIDHRLKIYFRVNSSMDRVVYRLFLGMFFFILYFNLLYLFPGKWINNLFWTTWVLLGLFYSWPTRGKIIKESVTSNFSEFRYLDSFEKTLVGLIVLMFLISIPALPTVNSQEAIKLFFVPSDTVSSIYWNFLTVNYYPFIKYEKLFSLGWSFHFYFVNMSLFLICFYALLRFFICRRLSLLGVFSVISSWSWTKILVANHGATLTGTYSLLWVWCLLWVIKSSTYRTGLFFGLVSFFGVLINQQWTFLWIPQIILMFIFMKDKSAWYKKQTIRYTLLGAVLTTLIIIFNSDYFIFDIGLSNDFKSSFVRLFSRKAIYSLLPIGLLLILVYMADIKGKLEKWIMIDKQYLKILLSSITVIMVYELFLPSGLFLTYSMMWVMALFSLFPLELIFQTMSRLRSSRNMIYLVYILICLLDSHFEGRVKVLIRMINSMS